MKSYYIKPTKLEQHRMDAIKEMAICMACRQRGLSVEYVEIHHLNMDGKAGQKRRGHRYTIGLCGWHHRGVVEFGIKASTMEAMLGPSLALASKKFRFWHGYDDELLAEQDRILGWREDS